MQTCCKHQPEAKKKCNDTSHNEMHTICTGTGNNVNTSYEICNCCDQQKLITGARIKWAGLAALAAWRARQMQRTKGDVTVFVIEICIRIFFDL